MKPEPFRIIWLDFKRNVYPEGMEPEQELQIFRAFASGSLATMAFMSAASDLPEDKAVKAITKFSNDLRREVEGQMSAINKRQ